MNEKKILSILVPVFNEEENVLPLYEAVTKELVLLQDRYTYEFIFTDNCSTDRTFEELEKLAAADHRVRVFRFSRNFGFQKSIATGFRFARGHAAIQLDCDLQDSPQLIADFIRYWEQGYAVVYGIRRSRREGWLISGVRKLFYRLINWLSEDELPLDAGDFRLVDRRIVEALKNHYDAHPYLRGAIATMGYAQKGIPYDRQARRHGLSKFSMSDLMGIALDGILNHSIVPLRIATYSGLLIAATTFAAIVLYAVTKVFFGQNWPEGFATTTVLLLTGISLNALFLGVIGEYLGRIYQQVKGRPITLIDKTIDHFQNEIPE